jgi:hypothetical protein
MLFLAWPGTCMSLALSFDGLVCLDLAWLLLRPGSGLGMVPVFALLLSDLICLGSCLGLIPDLPDLAWAWVLPGLVSVLALQCMSQPGLSAALVCFLSGTGSCLWLT